MLWEDNYLAHHGIIGQKWGVRRYQNPDGTLTAEGKARYVSNNRIKDNSTVSKLKDSNKSDQAKKLIIGLGAATLIAAAGYAAYKMNRRSIEFSEISKTMPLFKDAVDPKKSSELVGRLEKDFKENIESTLSDKEKEVIHAYSKDDYSNMNYLLERNNSGDSNYALKQANIIRQESLKRPGEEKRCQEAIKTLESVLDRTKTPEDMVVDRKTQFAYVRGMFGDKFSSKDLAALLSKPEKAKGTILETKGFCSTSIDPTANHAFGSCNLHIFVPKGSKGMFVAPISHNPKETEFVLQRNSKYRLLDVRSFTPGKDSLCFSSMELFLELINQ